MTRQGVLVAVTTTGVVALGISMWTDTGEFSPWFISTVAALAVGAVLTYRVPDNRVGWLLLLFAAGGGLGGLAQLLSHRVSGSDAAGWLDAVGYFFNTGIIVYSLSATLLRFPNGALLSRRWRWAEYWALLTASIGALAALFNGGWGGGVEQAVAVSPLREATAPLGDVLSGIFFPSLVLALGTAGVSVILRYRSSTGEERLQMKWLAYAGGILVVMLIVTAVFSMVSGEPQVALQGVRALIGALVFAFIPVAIAVAVLKYRLYDIDLVISRTVVLATLAGFITAVYALIVVGIGSLVGGDSDGLLLPITATAVVALAFEPVRHLAQGWANRLVFGRRATPYEVLADLTARLSHGEEAQGLLLRMAERLGDGTGAERATIWLGDDGAMVVGASWPAEVPSAAGVDLTSDQVFPVTHDGVVVGAFEVIKPRGSALSSAESALIADLAGSAGAVLGHQRLNDSLAQKAEELSRSRARLVEAQDRERRRLERDLHDGAQQLIVALKVKIGIARSSAARRGAGELETLLTTLEGDTQAALEEVRALAKGIYPPILESDGLESAVSALASGLRENVRVSSDGIRRYGRDIEAAVYFDISEAVTNAAKHASGPILVDIVEEDASLRFSVADSGPGFDVATANGGAGLQNLRDRIDAVGGSVEIFSSPQTGTKVVGEIPV